MYCFFLFCLFLRDFVVVEVIKRIVMYKINWILSFFCKLCVDVFISMYWCGIFFVKYFWLKDVFLKFVNYFYVLILENYDLDSDCEGENNR